MSSSLKDHALDTNLNTMVEVSNILDMDYIGVVSKVSGSDYTNYKLNANNLRNYIISGSVYINPSGSVQNSVSSSYAATASVLLGSISSASYATFAVTASYINGSIASSSYSAYAVTSNSSITSSYIANIDLGTF